MNKEYTYWYCESTPTRKTHHFFPKQQKNAMDLFKAKLLLFKPCYLSLGGRLTQSNPFSIMFPSTCSLVEFIQFVLEKLSRAS